MIMDELSAMRQLALDLSEPIPQSAVSLDAFVVTLKEASIPIRALAAVAFDAGFTIACALAKEHRHDVVERYLNAKTTGLSYPSFDVQSGDPG
jgi:hypothetical protein